jgi:hypothetical protein
MATNEIGDDLAPLATNTLLDAWLQEGRVKLGARAELTHTFEWGAGDTTAAGPASVAGLEVDRFEWPNDVSEETIRVWNGDLDFGPDGATVAGSVVMYYRGLLPVIPEAGADAGAVDEQIGRAVVSYALSRFYGKLASNRLFYKRYATTVGANAVSVDDLIETSSNYADEFSVLRDELPERQASTWWEN